MSHTTEEQLIMTEDNTSMSDESTTRRQNTFSWSSTSSSLSSASTMTTHHSFPVLEQEIEQYSTSYLVLLDEFNKQGCDTTTKFLKTTEILCRSASNGDIVTLRHVLNNPSLQPWIDLDRSDDETADGNSGSTPLIYASCFGKYQVVKYLLETGAQANVQDKIGWTALMWATTSNHSRVVELLLEHSASSNTRSNSGRTIYDLVDANNIEMLSILNNSGEPFSNSTATTPIPTKAISVVTLSKETDSKNDTVIDTSSFDSIKKDLSYCESSLQSIHKFIWNQCLPDQMFVFAEQDIDHILDVSISHLKLPMKSRSEIYVPANILFLASRFAHYYTNRELVYQFLSQSVHRIESVIKENSQDIHTLAFWIANLSQLLLYLKQDMGLVVATAEHQLDISELISEAYTLLVTDSERRLEQILEPAMLEFEPLDGLEIVDFADDWHRFFRRPRFSSSNRRSLPQDMAASNNGGNNTLPPPPLLHRGSSSNSILNGGVGNGHLSPQSITSLLTSILYVLQSYDVHPVIVIQAMAQLFHYLSCELFNRILTQKRYLCRSKALQIRMNLTVIEEWIREHQLPISLGAYFDPAIQLVQLLQCVSQLHDLMEFISTTKGFELLNPMQIRRLVTGYRYEVGEAKLPEEIEKYTMQTAEDTVKSAQMEKSRSGSIESFRASSQQSQVQNSGTTAIAPIISRRRSSNSSSSNSASRPNSVSSLGSLLLYSMNNNKKKKSNPRFSVQSLDQQYEMTDDCYSNNNEDNYWIEEKRDSKYMLPFSLPTTNHMVHSGWRMKKEREETAIGEKESKSSTNLSDTIYNELKQRLTDEREKTRREKSLVPTIPEEWLDKLDHHTGTL